LWRLVIISKLLRSGLLLVQTKDSQGPKDDSKETYEAKTPTKTWNLTKVGMRLEAKFQPTKNPAKHPEQDVEVGDEEVG
jgi:hypothetical protein